MLILLFTKLGVGYSGVVWGPPRGVTCVYCACCDSRRRRCDSLSESRVLRALLQSCDPCTQTDAPGDCSLRACHHSAKASPAHLGSSGRAPESAVFCSGWKSRTHVRNSVGISPPIDRHGHTPRAKRTSDAVQVLDSLMASRWSACGPQMPSPSTGKGASDICTSPDTESASMSAQESVSTSDIEEEEEDEEESSSTMWAD